MSNKHILKAQAREIKGKQVKKLRRKGLLPAGVSGLNLPSADITLNFVDFGKLFDQVGETGVIYLQTGDQEEPVLVEEVQLDPIKNQLLHVSLKRVNLKEKITAEVQIELVGENDVTGAVLVLTRDSIEVEALPTDLPEKFEIDATQFTEIGQTLTLADLKYDKDKVTLAVEAEELAKPIAILQEVKEEVEPEPVAAAGGVVTEESKAAEKPVEAQKEDKKD